MNKAENNTPNDYTIASAAGVVIAEVNHREISSESITEKARATAKSVEARIEAHKRKSGDWPERLDDMLYELSCAIHFEDPERIASIRRELGLAE